MNPEPYIMPLIEPVSQVLKSKMRRWTRDQIERWDERVAIRMEAGRMGRHEAEEAAFNDLVQLKQGD